MGKAATRRQRKQKQVTKVVRLKNYVVCNSNKAPICVIHTADEDGRVDWGILVESSIEKVKKTCKLFSGHTAFINDSPHFMGLSMQELLDYIDLHNERMRSLPGNHVPITVFLTDSFVDINGETSSLHRYVDDVKAVFAQVKEAGKNQMNMDKMAFGIV